MKQHKIIFFILSLSIFCVTNWEVCIKNLEVYDTMDVSQKMKSKTTMWSAILLLGFIQKNWNQDLEETLATPHIHHNIIYIGQDMKTV